MKLTIEVKEYELKRGSGCFGDHTPEIIYKRVLEAYEKEKNTIQVGDWYIENSGAIYMYCLGDDPPLSRCKRLSQPLQDMLEKEIKETTRNS